MFLVIEEQKVQRFLVVRQSSCMNMTELYACTHLDARIKT